MSNKEKKEISLALQTFYNNPIARVSLELFLTIATILFFALAAIRPTLLTMADLIKEIEDKKELSKKFDQKISSLASAQIEYAKLEDKIYLLDQAIPDTPKLIELLKTVEKVCSEEVVVIESFSVSEIPVEKEGVLTEVIDLNKITRKDLSLKLGLIGDYKAIRNVVEKLRLNRRLIAVDSITFHVNDNRGQKSLKATLSLQVPYYDVASNLKTATTQKVELKTQN